MDKKEFTKNVVSEVIGAIFNDPAFYDEIEYLVNYYKERINYEEEKESGNDDYEAIELTEEEDCEIIDEILGQMERGLSEEKAFENLGLTS